MDKEPLITDIIYSKIEKTFKNNDKKKLLLFSEGSFEQKITVPPESGEGGFTLIRLLNSLGIMITDHKNGKIPIIARGDTHSTSFKFTFNLSQEPIYGTSNRLKKPFIAAPSNTYIVSPNVSFKLNIPQENHQRWLSIVISPSLLQEILTSLKSDFPQELLFALENPENGYYLHISWTTPLIELAIEQILNCPYHGNLKRIYLEGKAIELIALRLGLLFDEIQNSFHSIPLSNSDIDKLHQIKKVLYNKINNPPSLRDVSKEFGLNLTKLKSGFRTLFGISIGEYIRNVRMKQARYLLEHQGFNVSQASYTVSYNNISHFIRAFKKRYGFCPGTYVKMKNNYRR